MLAYDVGRAEKSGVAFIHIDVTDGYFNPKVLLAGTMIIRQIIKRVKIPIQVHSYVTERHNRINES